MQGVLLQLVALIGAGIALAYGWAVGVTLWGAIKEPARLIVAVVVTLVVLLILVLLHPALPFA